MISEEQVRAALAHVKYPGFSRDIVSFGLVKAVRVAGNDVEVDISLATRDPNLPRQIHEQATNALKALPGMGGIKLNFDIRRSTCTAILS